MANEIRNHPKSILSYRFYYDGTPRIVDNVTIEGDAQQIIGFELRKAGKFSNRIKRYSLSKIKALELIYIPESARKGPKMSRPEGKKK